MERRDWERTPRALAAAQSVRSTMAAAFDRLERQRASRRAAEPPGGLFDETGRRTRDLFGEGG